jgi:CheY-like chemotaxis protein
MAEVKKILLVDDDADLGILLKTKLEKTERYKVTYTTNGAEALKLAQKESPDLIISDIDMPDMDGGDFNFALSENEKTRDIPVLFHSSLVSKSDVERSGGIIGGKQMVSKSADIRELIVRMEALMK